MGLELAYQLLAANSDQRLILTCRNQQSFDSAVATLSKRLEQSNLPIEFVAMDLLHDDSVKKAVSDIAERGLKIDILVNNAAILSRDPYPGVGSDSITVNFLSLKHFTEGLLANGSLSHGFRLINVSAILGNIAVIREDHMKEFKEAKIEDLEQLASRWIKLIDEDNMSSQLIDKQKSLAPEYAVSKILLNIYSRQLKDAKVLVDKNGGVVALHPGHIKTDMGSEYAPLERDEGVKPMLRLIQISDDEFKAFNGKFTNRHLEEIDFLDENVDFWKHVI